MGNGLELWVAALATAAHTHTRGDCLLRYYEGDLEAVYHIAKCKSMDWPLIGMSLKGICKSVIGTARAMGIEVTRELLPQYHKRDYTDVEALENMRKDMRQRKKAAKRAAVKK